MIYKHSEFYIVFEKENNTVNKPCMKLDAAMGKTENFLDEI